MDFVIIDSETVALDDAGEYLTDDPIAAPSNYRDPQKIEEYIALKTAERLARCALDIDLCRVVVLGWMFDGEERPSVIPCHTVEREREALEQFWRAIGSSSPLDPTINPPRLVSFNGFRFDLPLLMRRSDYLGVRYTPLNLDRYRSPHIDLAARLTFNGSTGFTHPLRFYAKRFGVPVGRPDISGEDIATLIAAGAWADIEAHCADDIQVTHGIARKLGLFSPSLAYARG